MPWHNQTHQEKAHTGGIALRHSKGTVLSLTSSRDKVEELWSLLKYDALIDTKIYDDLKAKGIRKPKREFILSELSAYIDQAENFYKFARNSDYRSAPLLYYYSFLNLAKASILVAKPELAAKTFRHGLSGKSKSGPLIDRSVKVHLLTGSYVSVFNELYRAINGDYIPDGRSLSFKHILGYITDISDEVTKLTGNATRKVHAVKLFQLNDTNRNKCWTVLATPNGFYPANYPQAFANFEAEFQRFNAEPLTRQFTFDMKPHEALNYNFSQSVTEHDVLPSGGLPTWETSNLINIVFQKFLQDDPYGNNTSFVINDPLRKNWQIPFSEPLAIYILMFYLSEIVRYNPGEFNRLLSANTKEGWLVKSFIESSPYSCLAYLTSRINGKTYIINER